MSFLAVKELNGCLRRPRTVSKTKSIRNQEDGDKKRREVQYPINLIKSFF